MFRINSHFCDDCGRYHRYFVFNVTVAGFFLGLFIGYLATKFI